MPPLRRIAPYLAVVLFIAACQPDDPADGAGAATATDNVVISDDDAEAHADIESVRQRATEWAASEAANDIDRTLDYMWEDAVMQPPNAPQIQGHEAIRGLYETVTFESLDPGPLTVHTSGDLAVVWSPRMTYTLEMGGDTISDDAKFVAVWKRRDGVWKVLENTWNTNLPPGGVGGGEAPDS